MANYILAQSFNKANAQDRLWYAMNNSDLNTLKTNEKILFGDKVYVITDKTFYIMGNNNTWYEM